MHPLVPRLVLVSLVVCASGAVGAQRPSGADPYEALTASQRRLLAGTAETREGYAALPEPFRRAFTGVTARLSAILLSDPENGEVLGSALDLIDRVEPPPRQPAPGPPGTARLAVTPAPGARDRLRRAREFARVEADGRAVFVHAGPPAIRIEIDDPPARAVVTLDHP